MILTRVPPALETSSSSAPRRAASHVAQAARCLLIDSGSSAIRSEREAVSIEQAPAIDAASARHDVMNAG
jgi:hypothetical protein